MDGTPSTMTLVGPGLMSLSTTWASSVYHNAEFPVDFQVTAYIILGATWFVGLFFMIHRMENPTWEFGIAGVGATIGRLLLSIAPEWLPQGDSDTFLSITGPVQITCLACILGTLLHNSAPARAVDRRLFSAFTEDSVSPFSVFLLASILLMGPGWIHHELSKTNYNGEQLWSDFVWLRMFMFLIPVWTCGLIFSFKAFDMLGYNKLLRTLYLSALISLVAAVGVTEPLIEIRGPYDVEDLIRIGLFCGYFAVTTLTLHAISWTIPPCEEEEDEVTSTNRNTRRRENNARRR